MQVPFHEIEPYYTGGVLGSSLQRENSSDETEIYGRNNGNSKDEIIFSELEAIEEELNTPQVTSDQPNVDALSLPNVFMNNDDEDPLEELVLTLLIKEPPSQNNQSNVRSQVTNDSLSNCSLPSRLPQWSTGLSQKNNMNLMLE